MWVGMNDGKLKPWAQWEPNQEVSCGSGPGPGPGLEAGKALCFWPEMNWQDGRAGVGRVTSLGSLWCLKLSSSRLLCFT